jgi:hypothetical protein
LPAKAKSHRIVEQLRSDASNTPEEASGTNNNQGNRPIFVRGPLRSPHDDPPGHRAATLGYEEKTPQNEKNDA